MSSVNMFNTGKSALFANKASLATTGHNIANVNTEGYSRQRVDQTTMPPHATFGHAITGTGVKINQIARINDDYLTRQVSNEIKHLGAFEEKDFALGQTEAVFNELTNEGLNRLITNFFNEFRKLGNNPENESIRMSVRESTNQLIGDFKRISRSIGDIQKNIDARIDSNVRQVNELTQRVAHLNNEIKRLEMAGGQTGDLRDKRDLAVKELSTILPTSIGTSEKGDFTVSIQGVGVLVSGGIHQKLYTESSKKNPESGKPEGSLDIMLDGLLPPKITGRFQNMGRLGGLVQARDEVIGSISQRMDELAYNFSKGVNSVHRLGYGLDNGTGRNYFSELTEIDGAAMKMSLSAEVQNDLSAIAAALEPDSPGDNRVVQLLGNLQFQKTMSEGKSTFDDFYNATVADLAIIQQKNKHNFTHQKSILGQLDKFRESISGVSLDEETTNLVQFQHAFDAAAKVIKVADEMLETILNLRR